MSSPATKSSYAGYRFPAEVISHAVWLYFRFPLSLRMVDEMLAARYPREPRDGAAMGAEVRPGLRQPDPAAAARGRRQMASRRGCGEDRRQEALAVAHGRPGRHCARRSGPKPA